MCLLNFARLGLLATSMNFESFSTWTKCTKVMRKPVRPRPPDGPVRASVLVVWLPVCEWKGSDPDILLTHVPSSLEVKDALLCLLCLDHLSLCFVWAFAEQYKSRALRIRRNLSSKSWRIFCLGQLSKGAGILHKFVNRPNSLPLAPLFRNGSGAKPPSQTLCIEKDVAEASGRMGCAPCS